MDVGTLHPILALIALASGAWTLARRKGNAVHRRAGWVFAGAMVGVNVTALLIYDLTGEFGPFHVMAVISLVGVVFGVAHVRLRRPAQGWRELHATWMAWSYVGLLAATAAEAATRIPDTSFWWTALAASASVIAVGGLVISRTLPRALARPVGPGVSS